MWLPLTLLVFVAAAAADIGGAWVPGHEYQYLVRSRTFTGLDDISPQYAGIVMKAILTVQPQNDETLRAVLTKPQYAQVHKELEMGWEQEISDQQLDLRDMPMSGKPFEVNLKHGTIRDLVAEHDVPTWEVNILKGIMSQFQVDTLGENGMKSSGMQSPSDGQNFAMFYAMEDTVGGNCETLYDITPLSENVLENWPELVPMPHLKGDGEHIDIIKTKNYSKCAHRVDYHFGITGAHNWEPGSNQNGKFISKSSNSRIVISGSMKSFIIQSSVTTNTMFVSLRVFDQHTGTVGSKTNVTLVSMKHASKPLPRLMKPESTGSLVYSYDNPFAETDGRKPSRPRFSTLSQENDMNVFSSSEDIRPKQWDSSEKDDFWMPKPRMDKAPQFPLLPLFIGNKGKAIGVSDRPKFMQRSKQLINDIANEMEDSSATIEQQTLEKFTILTSLIRTMDLDQIEELEGSMLAASNKLRSNSKDTEISENMWSVLRDAVGQAGTGPALLTIKKWIETKTLKNDEATDLVSRLPKVARTPTVEYVDTIFEMARDPQVMKQKELRSTVILTLSELVRQSMIDEKSMHNMYPVHVFGRIAPKDINAMINKVLVFLTEELRKAVDAKDSRMIQTCIISLGMLGHPKILPIFEPYLEGKIEITKFQRMLMVASLSKLAELNPKLARSVLYKIYLNTKDTHEVRCMAVYLLMKTDPPLVMLQRMADFTKYDTSKHVNSAVRTTLLSVARLERPETKALAHRAKIASYLLSGDEYDFEYSQGYAKDSNMGHLELAYRIIINYIGSDDHIIPRAWYLGLDASFGDFVTTSTELQFMVSSMKALEDVLSEKDEDETMYKDLSDTERIAKILGIEPDDPVKVEGNYLSDTKYRKYLATFDEDSVRQLSPDLIRKIISWKDGSRFNMNKLASYEMTLSFPTEAGLPFVYSLKIPTMLKISGTGKVDMDGPLSGNVKSDLRTLLASKYQAKMGFITPFDHQQFSAGMDMNYQMFLPIRVEAGLDILKKSFKLKLWPLKSENTATLIHFSTIPYTSKHDILHLVPIGKSPNTEPVIIDEVVSKETYFPSAEKKLLYLIRESDGEVKQGNDVKGDIWSMLTFITAKPPTQYRKVDITMDLNNEVKDPLVINVSVDSMLAEGQETENLDAWKPAKVSKHLSDNELDNEKRKMQLLKEAARSIRSGTASVIDVRLDTPGCYTTKNVATFAWANSDIEDKTRLLMFWQFLMPEVEVKYQLCAAARSKANVNEHMDFESILKSKPKVDFDITVHYGETCMDGGLIEVEGSAVQTQELRDTVRRSTVAEECRKEMKQGNKFLSNCRESSSDAMALNEMELSIDFHNHGLQTLVSDGVEMVQDSGVYKDTRVSRDNPKNMGKDKISAKIEYTPDFDSANVFIHTPEMDVVIPKIALPISTEVNADLDTVDMNDGICAIDHNQAETFDGRRYPLHIGDCWHVAMTTYPKANADKPDELISIPSEMQVTIATRAVDDGKEVKIILGEDQIILSPTGSRVGVSVNGKKIQMSQNKEFLKKNEEDEQLFTIVEMPNGMMGVLSDMYEIEVIHDGKRVKIQASDQYHSSVRGLCGNFDQEPENDFNSPKKCKLRNPEEFIASYALKNSECQGPPEHLRQKLESECKRDTVQLSNVINDVEAGRATEMPRKWGLHHTTGNKDMDDKRCTQYRTQVVEVDDEVCFTTRPVPTCLPECQMVESRQRPYSFYCMRRKEGLEMKRRVEKGANPDFNLKPVSFKRQLVVPLLCRA